MDYATKLKNPRWQKRRLEILSRDNFTCKLCGDKETTLHVHHTEYDKSLDPWNYKDEYLVTLCEHCHFEVEDLKKESGGDIFFSAVKIFKSNKWQSGDRIMFVSYAGYLTMNIYDQDSEYLTGFEISDNTLSEIGKIINITIND